MALEQKPLGTFDELANLTEYSKSTVFGIVKNLEATESHQPYFTVVAQPRNDVLGMVIVDVIIQTHSNVSVWCNAVRSDKQPTRLKLPC